MNFIEGEYIYLNKPYRMSSFGALARVRYLISQKEGVKRVKMGHAGTLDPLATGVLILCTGKKTKEIERLQYHTKEYTATLQLGATTPSYDMEHEVDATYPTAHITRELIEVELKPKTLHIDEIELTDFNPETMQASIRVVCGKGTYIRALARDIGEALGSGAYLTALCRTRLGDVRIEDCVKLDDVPEWLSRVCEERLKN